MANERNGVILMDGLDEDGNFKATKKTGWRIFDLPGKTLDEVRAALVASWFKELQIQRPGFQGFYVTPFHVDGSKAILERPFYHLPDKTYEETSEALCKAEFVLTFPKQ